MAPRGDKDETSKHRNDEVTIFSPKKEVTTEVGHVFVTPEQVKPREPRPADNQVFDELRQDIKAYKEKTSKAWREIAQEMNVKENTLQSFVSGSSNQSPTVLKAYVMWTTRRAIQNFKEEFGGSWREVAEELDLDKSTLYAFASGRVRSSPKVLDKFTQWSSRVDREDSAPSALRSLDFSAVVLEPRASAASAGAQRIVQPRKGKAKNEIKRESTECEVVERSAESPSTARPLEDDLRSAERAERRKEAFPYVAKNSLEAIDYDQLRKELEAHKSASSDQSWSQVSRDLGIEEATLLAFLDGNHSLAKKVHKAYVTWVMRGDILSFKKKKDKTTWKQISEEMKVNHSTLYALVSKRTKYSSTVLNAYIMWTIRREIVAYKDRTGKTWNQIAKELDVNESTLYAFTSGKTESSPTVRDAYLCWS